MSDATLISKKEVGTSQLRQFTFDIPALNTNTVSAEYRYTFDESIFVLTGIEFSCSATAVNFNVYDKSGVSTPSVHEKISQSNVRQHYSSYSLGIPIYNMDTTQGPYLYSVFRNNDILSTTGTMTMAFLVR